MKKLNQNVCQHKNMLSNVLQDKPNGAERWSKCQKVLVIGSVFLPNCLLLLRRLYSMENSSWHSKNWDFPRVLQTIRPNLWWGNTSFDTSQDRVHKPANTHESKQLTLPFSGDVKMNEKLESKKNDFDSRSTVSFCSQRRRSKEWVLVSRILREPTRLELE